MHSEPPRAAPPKRGPKRVVPKFVQRELDIAYAGLDADERIRFMRMAKGEIRRGFRRVRWANEAAERIANKKSTYEQEPLLESTRTVAEAVEKLVNSYDKLDGMCHRAYQRVEPFVKMAAKLTEEQRPTVQIVQIGQTGTDPAIRALFGAPTPREIIDATEEASEERAADGAAEAPDAVPEGDRRG